MEEIEDNTNRWKDYNVHGVEELIVLKCPHYPKQSKDLAFFTELEQIILKSV